MGWEGYFALGVVGVVFAGLVSNKAPDALLIGAVVLFILTGIITPQEAFAGFSNTGMLTVAALFVVAAALRETGGLDTVGAWMLGRARSERSVLFRLAATVTTMSAFLNNTPIVAMFIPILTSWCKKNRVAPSRLLIPLSYLCILGGTCTLIGTSTNLVVNGLMTEAAAADPELYGDTLRGMGLFEIGSVGLPCALAGMLYLMFVGHRLLPKRRDLLERLADSPREYAANLRLEAGCRLVDKRIEEAGLRHLPGLFLTEITRNGETIAPVPPDQLLNAGDILTFTGVVDTMVDLEKIPGLVPVADAGYEVESTKQRGRVMCEAVMSGTAPCIGKTIRAADFRATYNAAIIAVHRGREHLRGKVGDIVLRPGDTLLLQAGAHFARANRNNPDFLLVGGVEDSRPVRSDRALVALVLLLVLIALMASGVIEIVAAAFLIAGLMVATRCISVADARHSVDTQTLITICAAFGLGRALANSGCVAAVSHLIVDVFGPLGPAMVLAALFAVTSTFTMLITNNATAAIMFPFAIAIAGQMGVSPRPLVMAVALGASTCFASPIGYQTNLMIYAPGGYKFTDFLRVGLPLNIIMLITATLLIPLVWHF